MRLLRRLLFWLLISPIALVAQGIHYNYDALGRLVSVVDQNGNVASYVYDSNGNILSINRYTSTQVAVLSFSPDSGQVGAVVTISGANFGVDAAHNAVSFNGTPAIIQSATATQIVASVPVGATTGPISVVATAGSATSPNPFQIPPAGSGAPTIVSVSPSIATLGSAVVLTGTNFESRSVDDVVTVNGYSASVPTVSSSTSLTMAVPTHFGSGHVRLQTQHGAALSPTDLYVPPSPYVSGQVTFAQRTSSGVATTVSTSAAGNVGMLLIDGVGGQQASVVIANSTFPGCTSAIISVLAPDGSQIALTSMCGSDGFIDSFRLPRTGTYAVVIATPGGGGTASATVFVYSDLNSSIATDSSQSFATTVPGQNARFTFSGTAGQEVNAWLTNSTYNGCFSAAVTIQNPDGSQLATNSACNSSSAGLSSLTLPATGSYTLIVDPQGANIGSGMVTLSTDQLSPINVDSSVAVNIMLPGQNARYTFSGTTGENINATLTNSTFSGCFSVGVTVLNPDGSQLGSNNICGSGTDDLPFVTLPTTGTYTVIIESQYGGTGSGTLTLSADQNSTIAVNTSAAVSIMLAGQNARYTFSGTAGMDINVALTNSTFSGCFSVGLIVLNPDGSQLGSSNVCGGNSDLPFLTLPATGSYTIIVVSEGGTGSGTLTLSTDQNSPITLGNSVAVNIALPGQNARYMFGGTVGQKVNVALTNSTFSGCYSVGIIVLNPDSSQLGANNICFSGDADLPGLTLPTTGTYTIIVDSENGGTGSGTLLVSAAGGTTVAPVLSLASGTYPATQSLTITDAAMGAVIYYTTDGTIPTTASAQYSGPLSISSSETVSAMAVAFNYTNSPVATASYVIAPPVAAILSPDTGVAGITMVIVGSHFGATQGTSTVTLNGEAMTVSSWSDSRIAATVPSDATTGPVIVSILGVTSNSLPFTVIAQTGAFVRPITVAHANVSNTDQVSFPVLISGTYPFLATATNGGRVQSSNGYDVIFTSDSAGQNVLDFEIDSYNPANGAAAFWVRIPNLSHTNDTTIYMRYGIPGITESQENKPGVWSNGYAAVWHMGNGTTLSTTDSTGTNGDATNVGVIATNGFIGGAGSFANQSSPTYLDVANNASIKPATNLTLEAWFNASQLDGWDKIFALDYRADGSWNSPYLSYAVQNTSTTTQPSLQITEAGNGPYVQTANSYNLNTWNQVVGTYDGTQMIVYLNGASSQPISLSGPIDYGTSKDLTIGSASAYWLQTGQAWHGLLDELRISSVTRSSDWIATEYANQSSPSTFFSLGFETTGAGAAVPTINSISPNPVPAGGSISIAGSGFGATQGVSSATLNGSSVAVTSWSDTAITLGLPSSAVTGPILIAVGGVTSLPVTLSIVPSPAITNLAPSSGVAGSQVTVNGAHFGATQGTGTVTLNGQSLAIVSWTDTSIVATLPPSATSGNVVVSFAGTSSNSATFTVVGITAGFQRVITIDHTRVANSDQTSFPVLIAGTYPSLATSANGGRVQSGTGSDIIFTSDLAGQNLLDFEIDSYNPVNGAGAFWVRIPTLSHATDTTIYMWYGIPGITQSQENKPGVWSNGYAAVWHMGNGATLSTTDSTGTNGDATNVGVIATNGFIGGAGSFANQSSPTYLDVANNPSVKPATNLTLEAWFNASQVEGWDKIFGLDYRADGSWNSPYLSYALQNTSTSTPSLQITEAGYGPYVQTANSYNLNTWNQVVGTYDGTQMIVYLNGASSQPISLSGPIDYGTSKDLTIGSASAYWLETGQGWHGLLDELRISSVTRSPDWITTEYANQSSPSTFFNLGSETTGTGISVPTISSITSNPATSGAVINLVGTKFGQTQGSSVVTLNGAALSVTAWSDTGISLTLPTNATTGPVIVAVGGITSLPMILTISR